jgi:hypothetical protein
VRSALLLTLLLTLAIGLGGSLRAENGTVWLDRVNAFRASAGLPPVAEEPALSEAVGEHARYMVRHDRIEHGQDGRRRGATLGGAAAAAVSNLAGSTRDDEPDWWAVDLWMQAPFHALGILDPALTRVGFGIHRARGGFIQTAAGLDVLRGRVPHASAAYPIVWPGPGVTVPLAAHTGEYPSPLTSCAGYQAPSGLPLIVQTGSGGKVPEVLGSLVLDESGPLEHCWFTEATYRNPSASEQALGRAVLASRDAVIVVPRRPLRNGSTYRVILELARERRIDWSFRIAGASEPPR